MLIEKTIKIRINNFNEEHFKKLGYVFNKNDYVIIPINHLPDGSGIKVKVKCKYCGKIFEKSYRRYLETKNKICCNACKEIKMMETSLEKYGNICSLRNPKVLEKAKATNRKNLGVEYPFQNKEILKKCYDTSIKIYGEEYRHTITSKQQIQIHKIFGGQLNFEEYPYRLDIFFEKRKIYFEYVGSGHKLSIKLGTQTKQKFEEKEITRKIYLKNKGYKEFRIVSQTDSLPSNKELLKIKNRAFKILKTYNSYIYNTDTKTESFSE